MRCWPSSALVVLFACSFDSSGASGGSDGESSGTAESTSTASSSTTSAGTTNTSTSTTSTPTSSTTDTTGPGPTTSDSSTSGPVTTTESESSSTGQDLCNPVPEHSEILWTANAEIGAPMMLATSQQLPGNPMYAYSETAEQGTITFMIDVPCEDTYHVWGLAFDAVSAASPANPDSLYVSADQGNEIVWDYGCDSNFSGWDWYAVDEWTGDTCQKQAFSLDLTVGTHDIRLRNRENGTFDTNTAAVAAIVVSNDPGHDPNVDYDPNP